MQNVIVCKTFDEVNIDLARTWCEEDGMIFQLAVHGDSLFPAGAAALVIDLNHLALEPSERAAFVAQLADVVPPYPVAVASYDLEPEMIDTLKARGLLVFRRIEREMFYDLAKAMRHDFVDLAVAPSAARWTLRAPRCSMGIKG